MTRTTRRVRRAARLINNSISAIFMAAGIIFFVWFICSLIEVWNHGYASFDGIDHVYSNLNLFKLLFNL